MERGKERANRLVNVILEGVYNRGVLNNGINTVKLERFLFQSLTCANLPELTDLPVVD